MTKIAWNKGLKCSQETKDKISKAKKKNPTKYWEGKKRSEETKKKLSEKLKEYFKVNQSPFKGKKVTESERLRLTEMGRENAKKRIGIPLSDKTKERISIANTGRKHTKEFGENIKKRMLGKKASEETKKKMSLSSKGKSYYHLWSDEAKKRFTEATSKRMKGKKYSSEERKKHSIWAKKAGCGNWMKGRHLSEETKRKISLNSNAPKGENSPSWKGGVTPLRARIFQSGEYQRWVKDVLKKDNFICRLCGKKSGDGKRHTLCAHHIKPFSLHPEARFDLKNGVTLCKDCHRRVDTFNSKLTKNFMVKQERYFDEFLPETIEEVK